MSTAVGSPTLQAVTREFISTYVSKMTEAALAGNSSEISPIAPGRIVLYQCATKNGSVLGAMEITHTDFSNLTFSFVTFNDDGSVKASANDTKCRASYRFHLHNGVEGGDGNDAWLTGASWTPQNGARFYSLPKDEHPLSQPGFGGMDPHMFAAHQAALGQMGMSAPAERHQEKIVEKPTSLVAPTPPAAELQKKVAPASSGGYLNASAIEKDKPAKSDEPIDFGDEESPGGKPLTEMEEKLLEMLLAQMQKRGLELKASNLEMEDEPFASGNFSTNYRAIMKPSTKVVVKKFRANQQLLSTVQEVTTLSLVPQHDNIVNFVGYCYGVLTPEVSKEKEFWVITVEASRGALNRFLMVPENHERILNPVCLKWICADSAAGVCHLHKNNLIHRDLAARNLLLNTQGRVLVTDFGLARTGSGGSGGASEYKFSAKSEIPVLQAPEVEEQKGNTYETDVWSLAATWVEIFLGRQISLKEAATLPDGLDKILAKVSAKIPKEVFDVTKEMFAKDPKSRPTMEQVVKKLGTNSGESPLLNDPSKAAAPASAASAAKPAAAAFATWTKDDVKNWCKQYSDQDYHEKMTTAIGKYNGAQLSKAKVEQIKGFFKTAGIDDELVLDDIMDELAKVRI